MSHEIEVRIVCNRGLFNGARGGRHQLEKTSPDVRAAILELFERGSEKRVIVDLKGAEHIDSIAASVLVEGFGAAEKKNMDFTLTGLHAARVGQRDPAVDRRTPSGIKRFE